MTKQLVVIHGGNTFDSYEKYLEHLRTCDVSLGDLRPKQGWKSTLSDELGEQFDILLPRMPNGTNAHFSEWKIWFDKIAPLLNEDVVLVGHSLGGIFLAKYLSENVFPKKIRATVLIAAPFDEASEEDSLADFTLPTSLEMFAQQGGAIHLLHSIDDPVVPCSQVKKYEAAVPVAETHVFENKAHFNQETFPELVELLKEL